MTTSVRQACKCPAKGLAGRLLTGNIWSISTGKSKHKVGVLERLASETDARVVGLSESHLTKDMQDGEIKMTGYQV